MSLSVFNSNGLELIINTQTGEAFASASAIARMMTTLEKVISPFQITSYGNTLIKRGQINSVFEAEILTEGGLQGVKLYSEKAIREFAKKYNVDLLDKFADAGIRVFLHQLAGYQVTSNATEQPKETQKELTSVERADKINELAASLQFFGYEIQNPRFKQSIHDLVGDLIGVSRALPESKEVYRGVVERAEELGYPIAVITKHRSQLGKAISKIAKEGKLTVTQENRLCNGTQRPINLYLVCDTLDNAIRDYLDGKTHLTVVS